MLQAISKSLLIFSSKVFFIKKTPWLEEEYDLSYDFWQFKKTKAITDDITIDN